MSVSKWWDGDATLKQHPSSFAISESRIAAEIWKTFDWIVYIYNYIIYIYYILYIYIIFNYIYLLYNIHIECCWNDAHLRLFVHCIHLFGNSKFWELGYHLLASTVYRVSGLLEASLLLLISVHLIPAPKNTCRGGFNYDRAQKPGENMWKPHPNALYGCVWK